MDKYLINTVWPKPFKIAFYLNRKNIKSYISIYSEGIFINAMNTENKKKYGTWFIIMQ